MDPLTILSKSCPENRGTHDKTQNEAPVVTQIRDLDSSDTDSSSEKEWGLQRTREGPELRARLKSCAWVQRLGQCEKIDIDLDSAADIDCISISWARKMNLKLYKNLTPRKWEE